MSRSARWNALTREAGIAAGHLGNGATIVGKANYAYHAYYSQAFFALCTGIERSCKLALVCDYALENGGSFPSSQAVRGYGHNLARLLESTNKIAVRRTASKKIPRGEIHDSIIVILSDFARNLTRYYNIDFITQAPGVESRTDPISAWYTRVVLEVARKHIKEKQLSKIRSNAEIISSLTQSFTLVQHTSETGQPLDNVFDASFQTGITQFAQPYVRMYVLRIARFLGSVLQQLSYAGYSQQECEIPDFGDFFGIFNNPDDYFRRRKGWSIYYP